MIYHGFAPQAFIGLCANIIPIPKGSKALLTFSDKYCSIAISSVIGQILDYLIIDRLSDCLKTSDYQIGLKSKSSTALCSTLVTETIQYYITLKRQNECVNEYIYCCLMLPKLLTKFRIKYYSIYCWKNVCPKIVNLL